MLQRKKSSSGSASRKNQRRAGRSAKAKIAPVRRRFVITSSARRNAGKLPETNGKAKAETISAANGKSQNGHATPAASTPQSTVDLTETIKTLLHLAQENDYFTYYDINT